MEEGEGTDYASASAVRAARVIAPATFQDHSARRPAQALAKRREKSSHAVSTPRASGVRARQRRCPAYCLRHMARAGAGARLVSATGKTRKDWDGV